MGPFFVIALGSGPGSSWCLLLKVVEVFEGGCSCCMNYFTETKKTLGFWNSWSVWILNDKWWQVLPNLERVGMSRSVLSNSGSPIKVSGDFCITVRKRVEFSSEPKCLNLPGVLPWGYVSKFAMAIFHNPPVASKLNLQILLLRSSRELVGCYHLRTYFRLNLELWRCLSRWACFPAGGCKGESGFVNMAVSWKDRLLAEREDCRYFTRI